MARAKKWSSLSENTRQKYYGLGDDLGMTHAESWNAYNKGRWNPGSPDPEKRIPEKLRGGDWDFLAWDNMRSRMGDHLRWTPGKSDDRIEDNLSHATDVAKIAMAYGTENELTSWAEAGANPKWSDNRKQREALRAHPGWRKEDVGYFDANDRWHSIFWYH